MDTRFTAFILTALPAAKRAICTPLQEAFF
jgi:hypothetical protein